jgi:hypothetical protein
VGAKEFELEAKPEREIQCYGMLIPKYVMMTTRVDHVNIDRLKGLKGYIPVPGLWGANHEFSWMHMITYPGPDI